MKTNYRGIILACMIYLLILGSAIPGTAQVKMSLSHAFNALNAGSSSHAALSGTSSAGVTSIMTQSYNKNVTVSYGIPIEIVMEFAALKANLSAAIASDPGTYNNSADNVQQAFVNLAYGDFVRISDYKKVNVKLNFRFNPPKLRIYGSDESDFVNATTSSPYDPGVYVMPTTPVRGSKIMVIIK